MRRFIIIGLILAVGLSLVAFAEEEKEVEIKYKPQKIEVKVPALTPKQLGEFKDLDDFIREKIAEHPGANFFFLAPSGHASQQGVVDKLENNVLTVNSQGFKMNWQIATDTQVIAAQRLNLLAQVNPQTGVQNITVGQRVRILGVWDGNNLVAKKVVVLEPRRVVIPQVIELLQKVQEALRKAGINIDLAPLFQQLQPSTTTTSTPTSTTTSTTSTTSTSTQQ